MFESDLLFFHYIKADHIMQQETCESGRFQVVVKKPETIGKMRFDSFAFLTGGDGWAIVDSEKCVKGV
jgi:hypothetical protein